MYLKQYINLCMLSLFECMIYLFETSLQEMFENYSFLLNFYQYKPKMLIIIFVFIQKHWDLLNHH